MVETGDYILEIAPLCQVYNRLETKIQVALSSKALRFVIESVELHAAILRHQNGSDMLSEDAQAEAGNDYCYLLCIADELKKFDAV